MFKSRMLIRAMAVALVFGGLLVAGFITGRVSADQPMMHSALNHLRAAESDLREATRDKGGHRNRALRLVQDAIREVEKGMEFDRRH